MSKSASPLASPGRGLRNNLKNLKESLRFLKPSSSTSKILLTKKEDQNKFSTEQGIPHSVNDNCQIDCPCVEFLSPDEARILKKKSKSEKNLIDAAEEEMQRFSFFLTNFFFFSKNTKFIKNSKILSKNGTS